MFLVKILVAVFSGSFLRKRHIWYFWTPSLVWTSSQTLNCFKDVGAEVKPIPVDATFVYKPKGDVLLTKVLIVVHIARWSCFRFVEGWTDWVGAGVARFNNLFIGCLLVAPRPTYVIVTHFVRKVWKLNFETHPLIQWRWPWCWVGHQIGNGRLYKCFER